MFLVRGIIAVVFGVLALVLSPGITLLFLVYLDGSALDLVQTLNPFGHGESLFGGACSHQRSN